LQQIINLREIRSQIRIQSTLSEPLPIRNGVHQGDALACLLFNIALEKVIRDVQINTRGSSIYKSIQIFAYADDNIVGRSQAAMKEAYISLERQQRRCTCKLTKKKYMPVTKKDYVHIPPRI
jgi:sorting nexin-29